MAYENRTAEAIVINPAKELNVDPVVIKDIKDLIALALHKEDLEKVWDNSLELTDDNLEDYILSGKAKKLIFKLNSTNEVGLLLFEIGISKVYYQEGTKFIIYFDEVVNYLYSNDISDATSLKLYKFAALDIENENILYFVPDENGVDVLTGTISISLDTQVKIVA